MDRQIAPGALVLVDAAAIRLLWPDLNELAHGLRSPSDWVQRCGADVAAATLATTALWLVALWLGLGLTAATVRRLPAALARACRRLLRIGVPAALYRAKISDVVGAAGLGPVFTPASAISRHAPPAAAQLHGAGVRP